jgi:hypothetical protein
MQMHRPEAVSQWRPEGQASSRAHAHPPSGVVLKPSGQHPAPVQMQASADGLHMCWSGQHSSAAHVHPFRIASHR